MRRTASRAVSSFVLLLVSRSGWVSTLIVPSAVAPPSLSFPSAVILTEQLRQTVVLQRAAGLLAHRIGLTIHLNAGPAARTDGDDKPPCRLGARLLQLSD